MEEKIEKECVGVAKGKLEAISQKLWETWVLLKELQGISCFGKACDESFSLNTNTEDFEKVLDFLQDKLGVVKTEFATMHLTTEELYDSFK